jgi:hypothetical protein
MRKLEKVRKLAKNQLDRFSEKPRRGRPPKIDPSFVRGCADKYRVWLERAWKEQGEALLAAQTEQEITKALQIALPGYDELIRLAPSIFKVRKDLRFPKRKRAQINFLADSIAANEIVTPRRSRDICAEERAADAQRHVILRYEYWIECSCGYKGRSENHSCRKCGAILDVPNIASEYA